MIKVIETNVMFKDIEIPCDTQSRIIEVDNWGDYVNEIKIKNRSIDILGLEVYMVFLFLKGQQ